MRLDTKALGLTFGLLWGGAILLVGIANLIWPDYGGALLGLAASGSFGQVIIGTLYGLVDGFIGGLIVGWVYNYLAPVPTAAASG